MTRGLSTTNQNQSTAQHAHVVWLVRLDFDTPVYVHSGVGTIPFDGNDYLGQGNLGAISSLTEQEQIEPKIIRLELSGVDANELTEALDAGTFRDLVYIYQGYRLDSGALADGAFVLDICYYEFSDIDVDGGEAKITVTLKTDLARLDEADGSRWTDEDQRARYPTDTFFAFLTDAVQATLTWGGRKVSAGGRDFNDNTGDRDGQP